MISISDQHPQRPVFRACMPGPCVIAIRGLVCNTVPLAHLPAVAPSRAGQASLPAPSVQRALPATPRGASLRALPARGEYCRNRLAELLHQTVASLPDEPYLESLFLSFPAFPHRQCRGSFAANEGQTSCTKCAKGTASDEEGRDSACPSCTG